MLHPTGIPETGAPLASITSPAFVQSGPTAKTTVNRQEIVQRAHQEKKKLLDSPTQRAPPAGHENKNSSGVTSSTPRAAPVVHPRVPTTEERIPAVICRPPQDRSGCRAELRWATASTWPTISPFRLAMPGRGAAETAAADTGRSPPRARERPRSLWLCARSSTGDRSYIHAYLCHNGKSGRRIGSRPPPPRLFSEVRLTVVHAKMLLGGHQAHVFLLFFRDRPPLPPPHRRSAHLSATYIRCLSVCLPAEGVAGKSSRPTVTAHTAKGTTWSPTRRPSPPGGWSF